MKYFFYRKFHTDKEGKAFLVIVPFVNYQQISWIFFFFSKYQLKYSSTFLFLNFKKQKSYVTCRSTNRAYFEKFPPI